MNTVKYNIVKFIVVSILILVLSGCTNLGSDVSNSTPYYKISKEFADYCWFDTESYWIFQNDSTLSTDTIKVVSVNEFKRFHNQQTAFNYEAIEMAIKSNAFGFIQYELTAGNFEVSAGEMNSLLRLYKSDGTYQLIFLPQFTIGEDIIMGDEIGTYTNIELLSTFQLNNRTYSDVYHTRIVISMNTSTEYNYWIAKNNSIIKSVSTINGQTISISLIEDNLISH